MKKSTSSIDNSIYISAVSLDSVVDGPGIRAVIFFSGCDHKCKGCHNPETWSKYKGTKMSTQEIMAKFKDNRLISSVTFSGGDPVYQWMNSIELATECKKLYNDMILYTGFTYTAITGLAKIKPQFIDYIKNFDYIIPEPFDISQRDLTIAYRGSRNQRIYKLKDIDGKQLIYDDVTDEWDRKYSADLVL